MSPQPYTFQHLIWEPKIQDFCGHDPFMTLTRSLTLGKGRHWAVTGLCRHARQSTRLIHPCSLIKSSQQLCSIAIILPTLQIRKLWIRGKRSHSTAGYGSIQGDGEEVRSRRKRSRITGQSRNNLRDLLGSPNLPFYFLLFFIFIF